MTNIFKTILSDAGKVALGAVHLLNRADKDADTVVPEIQKVLEEGASITSIIPGVNAEVAPLLNAGISLLGASKAVLDGTVAIEPTVETQIAALAPAGYSFLLVEADVKADVETLLATYKAEFETAKTAVATVKAAA